MLNTGNGSHFYHASARKIVAAFGTLFNNIILHQYNTAGDAVKATKVPINYASKQHFIAKLRDDANKSSSTGIDTSVTLPTISFSLDTLTYDFSRQKNPLNYSTKTNTNDPYVKDKTWNPSPYIYNFTLTIFANKTEDGLQIIEQIIPWFTPELNVPINMLDGVIDVPIELEDISFEDNWEEGFENNRLITWNLSFSAKGLFFKPTTTPTNIQRVVIDVHNEDGFSTPIEFGTINTRNFSYLVDGDGNYIVDNDGNVIISQEE